MSKFLFKKIYKTSNEGFVSILWDWTEFGLGFIVFGQDYYHRFYLSVWLGWLCLEVKF